MPQAKLLRRFFHQLASRPWQSAAFAFCVSFGLVFIVNVQLAGDSMWFWYATFFHEGVKLYADLHLALQPLFVMETDWWMLLAGKKCIPYQGLGVLHMLALCAGMLLLLRESAWPDWQKAAVFFGSFFVMIRVGAYRFDDSHIIADFCAVYLLVLLLLLAKAESSGKQTGIVTALGVVCGLAITTRINDGAGLFSATGVCLLFVARERKLKLAALFAAAAALTAVLVVAATGDSARDYLQNSIFKAAGAKGGTGTVLRGPFVALMDNLTRARSAGKRILVWIAAMAALGAAMRRYWKMGPGPIFLALMAAAAATFGLCTPFFRGQVYDGLLIATLSMFLQPTTYFLALAAAIRYALWRTGRGARGWNPRETLILVPIATLAASATSQVNGTSSSFVTLALLLLLVPIVGPLKRPDGWANAPYAMLLVLLGMSGLATKVRHPYEWWTAGDTKPMFVGREWYRHPVYGLMYIDSDLLHSQQKVCALVAQGDPRPELLSIPFPYANYFCAVPPWHGYVQTWYDSTAAETILGLVSQLEADPPRWILYDRQPKALRANEMEFNHGQPIAHRRLDELIMSKIAAGEWQVVETESAPPGERLLIRTRP